VIEFEITDPQTSPPNGWRYRQPESGLEFRHYSRDAFFKEIQSHRLANGYEITPDWKERIESDICREHMAEWGAGICRRVQHLGERKAISFAAAQSFLNTMGSWLIQTAKGEDAFVSQEEADRRARICVTCPNNIHSFGGSCGSCADRIMRALLHVVGKRSTRYDHNLGACAICSCSLAAAVHVPLAPQRAGLSEELKVEFRAIPWCWKKNDDPP
jgi:hypothetical protein